MKIKKIKTPIGMEEHDGRCKFYQTEQPPRFRTATFALINGSARKYLYFPKIKFTLADSDLFGLFLLASFYEEDREVMMPLPNIKDRVVCLGRPLSYPKTSIKEKMLLAIDTFWSTAWTCYDWREWPCSDLYAGGSYKTIDEWRKEGKKFHFVTWEDVDAL